MSKKNSSVILKNQFKNLSEFSEIYKNFEKKIDFLKKKSFLVAISGGPDSLALTALAKSYHYKNINAKIYYVLVDHKIRKNSSKEALLVKKLLKKHQIDLNILINKKKIYSNTQSEARKIRYSLLTNFCKKKKIKNILTAHNFEDQVETFFIRLSRGSGLKGLSSMKLINKIENEISLVRPLLDFKKSQLSKISKTVFTKYFKDPSNKDKKYLRTRIRNLKKTLELSGINYNQIFRSIKNLASSQDTLDFYFNKTFRELVTKRKNKIYINLSSFKDLNDEMKMKVLEKSIKDLTNSYYSPRSKKILNLIVLIKTKKKLKSTLGGCLILTEKNQIILYKETKI